MALSDVTKEAVLKAVEEFYALGQNVFLQKYGFGKSTRYLLRIDGEDFDSKAIVGAAHGYIVPELGPLANSDFSGGKDAAAGLLERLGFQIIEKEATSKRVWTLEDLSRVQREHHDVSRSFEGQFTRSDFDERYRKMFPDRNPNSFLPSDFSHNNRQQSSDLYPSFLETVGDSIYQFVGLDTGHEVKTRNPLWTRDELILATYFYKRHAPQIPGKTDERLVGLADEVRAYATSLGLRGDETFRNPNGVYMKLMELRKYDPEYQGKGLGHGKPRPLEQEVWDLQAGELNAAARSIREALKSIHMNQIQFEIARFLSSKARLGKRTTYQEVAEAVGWPHPTGRGLGKNLYAILRYMHHMQFPPLTAILVRKGHRYPDEEAMSYIQDVIGDVDISGAQESVFSYDWESVPELRSISEGLPGGRELWQASFKEQSVADTNASRNNFLLKFNGELHGPGGISRPHKLEDWENEALRMPWTSPRSSSRSDKSQGPRVAVGDLLYLWAHEDEAFGSGLGLTGVAKAKRVTEENGFLNILLGDLALLRQPFGFRVLEEESWQSIILDRINEDRSPRAWTMTSDEQSEIDKTILVFGSRKAKAIENAELDHLSALDRALNEDKDKVETAEEERKTATIKARPDQQKFRGEAIKRHGGRCVVTGFKIPTVLEAAHVIPHTGNPAFEVPENSLILRRDVHALFDAGMIAINPKSGKLVISPELKATAYKKLEGKPIDHKLATASLAYQHARFKKSNT